MRKLTVSAHAFFGSIVNPGTLFNFKFAGHESEMTITDSYAKVFWCIFEWVTCAKI